MATKTWKIGDIVWHKSGPPKMVVSDVGSESITCRWNLKGEFTHDEFLPDELTDKNPNPGPDERITI